MKKLIHRKLLLTVTFLFLLLAAFTIIFYIAPNKNNYMDKLNRMENKTSASMAVYAKSFDELIDLSDIIIEGRVVDYEPHLIDRLIFTYETVEVKKVLKGNLTKGDQITVVFTGGELNGNVTPPIEDCPIMDMRGNYSLFLKTNDGKNYFIIGGNQGFGLIKDNKIKVTDKGILSNIFQEIKVDQMEKNMKEKFK